MMNKPSKNRIAGGKRVAAKLKAIEPNYYKRIGYMGGSAPKTKPSGYATNRQLASESGKKGGLVSGYKRRARSV